MDFKDPSPGEEPDPQVIADLMSKLRRWEHTHQRSEAASPEGLTRRVAKQLAPHMGTAATNVVLEPVTPDGDNLLSTIESTLRLFLGRAAASVLVSRIVDHSIVRT